MNISMQLTVVVVAACLCLADSAPDGRLVRKQQRPTRGFKNVEMMTARGFGKRDRPHTRTERDTHLQHGLPSGTDRTGRSTPTFKSPTVNIARDFGKRAPELENEAPFGDAPARRKFDPKNSLMVAYDFGKRSNDFSDEEEEIRVTRGTFRPSSKILIARGYGKRGDESDEKEVVDMDDFLEALASPEREGQEMEDKTESMPLELLVLEMMNNPDFTRSVVRKFIDINQDGMLSLDELLRNVA